jgi:hypothetical protein
MRGLELGPLNRPRIRPDAGDVRYVDCFSTEELRNRYSANSSTRDVLDEIVDVHYVVRREQSVSEVAGRDAPFDYVLASHVIEHVANPIGWLQDLQGVLGDGGVLSLVVPDRRFSFDVNRADTRSQDWIDWYLRDLRSPGPGQIFDFFAHVTTIDGTVTPPVFGPAPPTTAGCAGPTSPIPICPRSTCATSTSNRAST